MSFMNNNLLVLNDYGMLWQLHFQEEATPIMMGMSDLHDSMLFYLIMVLVCVSYFLCVHLMGRSSISLLLVSSDFNHSTIVELIWTMLPALVRLIIAVPSFKRLYSMDEMIKPLVTLKVQGSQWYWTYNFADVSGLNVEFTSYPKEVADLDLGGLSLLDVDNSVILPILKPISVRVTASDVMHAWAVPSRGMKMDAMPGSMNHGLLYMLSEGLFYGQCSELCGQGHAYMPMAMESVSEFQFMNWLMSFTEMPLKKLINVMGILKEMPYK